EPVDTHDDPALGAERSEALELAVLLLLERLRPRERAVYVLREAFGYPYARIAEMLQLTEAHARQLASRARKSLGAERRQSGGTPAPARCLLAAAGAGDRTPSRNDALSGPSWSDWRCASAPAFAEARTPTKPQHKIEGD